MTTTPLIITGQGEYAQRHSGHLGRIVDTTDATPPPNEPRPDQNGRPGPSYACPTCGRPLIATLWRMPRVHTRH